jgi:hypothetical protein
MSTNILPQALSDYAPLPPETQGSAWRKEITNVPYSLYWPGKGGQIYDVYGGSIYYALSQRAPLYIGFEGQALDGSCNAICSGRRTISLMSYDRRLFAREVSVLSEPADGNNLHGIVHNLIQAGNYPSITSYRWCYLNGPVIKGNDVDHHGRTAPDRLVFVTKEHIYREIYQIILENQDGYQTQKACREISHHCEIRAGKDLSKLDFGDVEREIQLFSRFVSFFSGTHHAPWFIEGMDDNYLPIFQFHECGYDTSMRAAVSWKPTNGDKDLIKLWPLFRSKYTSSPQRTAFMDAVLNCYLEANDPTKPLAAAIASAINGLETIASVLFREWGSVDVLLDRVDGNLRRYYNYDGACNLCTADITGRLSPLPYADDYSPDAQTCLDILLQYLELTILFWLGYEGKYYDRVEKKNKRVKIIRP